MYKSLLQELCQRRSWGLPDYTVFKDGPDHMPRFTAVVNVHGQVFETPAQCKSLKEAQITAARIAFDHFNAPPPPTPPQVHCPPATTSAPPAVDTRSQRVSSKVPSPKVVPVVPRPKVQPVASAPPLLPLSPLPSSLPTPPPGLLAIKAADTKPANGEVLQQQNCKDNTQGSMVYRIALGSRDEEHHIETVHMYKNQLQQYAQRKSIGLPMYTTEAEGPPHARRFKSTVSLDGKTYQTLNFFPTLKEAEQAAAKNACQILSINVIQEDGGLYKNLLQELAQKKGLTCPSYETVKSGMSHMPSFASTVELGGHTYRGAEARTKKQAEMNAAKAAYCALTESEPATEDSSASCECEGVDNVSPNIQPSAVVKKRHDQTVDEADVQPKRAKSSPEKVNVNVNTHIPGPSEGLNSPSDYSTTNLQLVAKEQFPEEQIPLLSKTVVYPRKSNLPKPEYATMLPFSDDQWVAYKVGQDQEPTART